MDNATHCKKCQLTFNKSQVDYDVNFCPICGDTIGEPVERVVSKSCPECKNTFTKSFDIDADAALEAEYDLCFCPQCGAKLIAGKAKEEQGEELIEEGAQEIAEGNEGETPAEEASEIATPEKEDEDIDLDGESDDEDLMIDLDKALASIAVATSPKGAKTVRDGKYPDKTPAAKTSYPSKDVKGLGSVKVADSPDGAKTKFTTKAQKKADLLKNLEVETGSHDGDSGPAINDFDDKYVDPSTGERTDSADSTLHEQSEAYFQPMEGGASEAKWKNYEQDRKMKKSALEDEVSSLRKSIDELKSVATRRGIVTNTLMAPEVAPTQEALDRHLAQVFTGKLKG